MENNKYEIEFSRDSVCMGDDVFDHKIRIEFDGDDNWDELISKIKENHFLASISGNNVVWVLCNKKECEIFSYFTKKDKVIKCINDNNKIKEICKEDNHFHFKYFSSPLLRGQYIFNLYKGDKHCMWHDGWIEEYQQCEVSTEMENEWKNQFADVQSKSNKIFNENDIYFVMVLKALRYFYWKSKNSGWEEWISKDIAAYLERGSIEHHRQAYGGMGSINDFYICPGNGNNISEEAIPWGNDLLMYLLSLSGYLSRQIQDEKRISKEGVWKQIDKMPVSKVLQGWRCLQCGYGELAIKDVDSYLTKLIIPSMLKKALDDNKMEQLIDMFFDVQIPDLENRRNEVIYVINKSGINFGKNPYRPCVRCKGNDTAVYRWKFVTKKNILGIEKVRLVPADDNLMLRKK